MSLPWPFSRRGTSAAAEVPRPSGSGSSGALFGRPLAEVCSQDGTLPQPIQDLLALLREHGPSSEGIFRLAAGERASRELREALDSGAEVHLESQPPHLLAVVLKDFLRKIPSKLLRSELFEQWMGALQVTSRQEKVAALKEVASQLPKANFLLLKELLFVLHKISRSVATSRMTAHNLAICVGPNLLSPPEEHTLPLEALAQVTQKVGCVDHLPTAFWAQPSFAAQRVLAASSLQQTWWSSSLRTMGNSLRRRRWLTLPGHLGKSCQHLRWRRKQQRCLEWLQKASTRARPRRKGCQALPMKSGRENQPAKRQQTGNPRGRRASWKGSSQGWRTEDIQAGKKNEEPRCQLSFPAWIPWMSSNAMASRGRIVQPQHYLRRDEERSTPALLLCPADSTLAPPSWFGLGWPLHQTTDVLFNLTHLELSR
ncbi:PREDICTED: rho GTPase-activating protein 33-like [Calidris pugnax]|uniref:rho GTPase-activating protein 33-like n=1 Tax=Calidris pugnax TaxID=198806 RepID=UPI00071DB0EE|nr:PREDICTED: rho GTPase-activating protein 33-like [Calidris pugnax]